LKSGTKRDKGVLLNNTTASALASVDKRSFIGVI